MATQEMPSGFVAGLSESAHRKKWLFNIIEPYISGRVLEVNSGRDSFAVEFMAKKMSIHLSDPAIDKCQSLLERFTDVPSVRAIHEIDFLHPDFRNVYSPLAGRFKTIIAINIVDCELHSIKLIFGNVSYLLRERGRLVTIAPSLTGLYEGLELEFNEWRAYNRKLLRDFIAGFKVINKIYFDAASNFQTPLTVRNALETLIIARKIDYLLL